MLDRWQQSPRYPGHEEKTVVIGRESYTETREKKWWRWMLSSLPEGYQLGGLIDELGFSQGFPGAMQRLERGLGVLLLGGVEGYENQELAKIHAKLNSIAGGNLHESVTQRLQSSPLIGTLAYKLFEGHIDGMRRYQEENRLKLFSFVLERTLQEAASPGSAYKRLHQIEAVYATLPSSQQPWAKEAIEEYGEQIFALEKLIVDAGLKIVVPYQAPLLPETIVDTSTLGLNQGLLSNPLLRKLRDIIADTTYRRILYAVDKGNPVSDVHNTNPQAVSFPVA